MEVCQGERIGKEDKARTTNQEAVQDLVFGQLETAVCGMWAHQKRAEAEVKSCEKNERTKQYRMNIIITWNLNGTSNSSLKTRMEPMKYIIPRSLKFL